MVLLLRLAATLAKLCTGTFAARLPISSIFRDGLPVVDLGYQLQRATTINDTGNYYNFSNIRYAQAPTDQLRFREPVFPKLDRLKLHTGDVERICPQANAVWSFTSSQSVQEYLQGKTEFLPTDFAINGSAVLGAFVQTQDPRESEDCLFLDVMVPKQIFDNRNKSGAAVLVWVHGGGYTSGSKTGDGSPAGILARSQDNQGGGVVYVSVSYRLGAFGFSSGPTFEKEGGIANAALYDQRAALLWVQQNIHLFGGDPRRVTVMGQSAGAGSLMHHVTAFGGQLSAPFQQAIIQSPGFQATTVEAQQEAAYNTFLNLLNVSTLEQLRELPSSSLRVANILQVGSSPYGQFTYGPTVDGKFAPKLPGQLLAEGSFHKNLKLMLGQNADEGLVFTSPFVSNNSAFDAFITDYLPSLANLPSVAQTIFDVLYPPIFDGSQAQGYTNQLARASAALGEQAFTCNTYYLDKAFNNQTYSYLFIVPPAVHGQDRAYTFYDGPAPQVDQDVALAMQRYVTRFAMYGDPNGEETPQFDVYGDEAMVQVLKTDGFGQTRDPAANERCEWWQKALYAQF
ncbi:hypothetical protein DOTSEDRAFT_74915 [Dothistroma septosporum NZE10]|uniref:Carboxylic ester hydrolase n=1 Tax=Dothistroma septosporum (strain NZE10 / CBS 128990) TaxID=675120 RepID=N1PCL8_DOTSN|nr:hypothetical protein DOTSEDRAFT_74915 [Dothistroma septosporum NZE10]